MRETLRDCFLFAELSEPQLDQVVMHSVRLQLKPGETLFEQGDEAKRFYLATAGQIKLFRLSPAGNEKVIDVITAGQTFAEALMFLEHPHYPVGAQALQASEVISIDSLEVTRMLKASIETCFAMMASMSHRLHAQVREIAELSLHNATCRVAAYLLKQSELSGEAFRLDVPKHIVASRLSIKPETFSRIVKNLTDHGTIALHGSQVEVLDPAALESLADTCRDSDAL